MIENIPVVKKKYGEIEGLPAPREDITCIVSVVVLSALQGKRSDVVCPDTGVESVVRDAKGNILGVQRLQQA